MTTKVSQSIIKGTKTTRPSTKGLNRKWFVLDASKAPMGRIATIAANILMGKNSASYAADVDMGGCVVIINCDQTQLTGMKSKYKVYFRHSTPRPGSMKSRTFEEQMNLDSTRPMYLAIKRMLPKNRQQDVRMNNRLYLFKDETHNITQNLTPAN